MIINVDQACQKLKAGEVVAIPTDTVYGLATLPENQEKIYELKQRSHTKKIIYLISDINQIPGLRADYEKHLARLWPGPYSVIINNQGYRIPNHSGVLELIKKVGQPLAVSSANLSGQSPAICPETIEETFSGLDILENNEPLSAQPSTIFILEGDEIIKIR